MTIEQFNNTKWGAGMRVSVKGRYSHGEYDVVSVCFDQALIACDMFGEDEEPKWFRCENCELVICGMKINPN